MQELQRAHAKMLSALNHEIRTPLTGILGMSDLLPAGVSTDGTFAHGAGFGAGGRVGRGATEGIFGWGGAAGTIAFVDPRRKVRATGMIQYMPSNAQGFHDDFGKWVVADLQG